MCDYFLFMCGERVCQWSNQSKIEPARVNACKMLIQLETTMAPAPQLEDRFFVVCGQDDDGEITVHIYQDKDAAKHGYDHLSYDTVVYEGCEYEGVPVLSVKTACDLYCVESATSYDEPVVTDVSKPFATAFKDMLPEICLFSTKEEASEFVTIMNNGGKHVYEIDEQRVIQE